MSGIQKNQFESFIENRYGNIRINEGVLPIENHKRQLVFHLIPLNVFDSFKNYDIQVILSNDLIPIPISRGQVEEYRFNVNGIYSFSKNKNNSGSYISYAQFFRSGTIESVMSLDVVLKNCGEPDDTNYHEIIIPGLLLPNLEKAYISYIKIFKQYEISPPFILKISLFGVKNVEMGGIPIEYKNRSRILKVDEIILPPSVITENHFDKDPTDILHEQFNILWNAFGIERCMYD